MGKHLFNEKMETGEPSSDNSQQEAKQGGGEWLWPLVWKRYPSFSRMMGCGEKWSHRFRSFSTQLPFVGLKVTEFAACVDVVALHVISRHAAVCPQLENEGGPIVFTLNRGDVGFGFMVTNLLRPNRYRQELRARIFRGTPETVDITQARPVNADCLMKPWGSIACYNDASNVNLHFALDKTNGYDPQAFFLAIDAGDGTCRDTIEFVQRVAEGRYRTMFDAGYNTTHILQDDDEEDDVAPVLDLIPSDFSLHLTDPIIIPFKVEIIEAWQARERNIFEGIPDPSDFHCSSVNFSTVIKQVFPVY